MSDQKIEVSADSIGCTTVFILMALVILLAKPIANQIHQGWLQGEEEYRQEKLK